MRTKHVLVALALLGLGASSALAGEFSAKLIQEARGQEARGRILVKGPRYRLVQQERGRRLVILVDPGTALTRILSPDVEAYSEVACDHPLSLMNDPFQAVRQEIAGTSWHAAGSEVVAGRECMKSILRTKDGEDLLTRWVCEELGFPLKIAGGTRVARLEDIRVRELPDSLFEVPQGYRKMTGDELGEALHAGAAPESVAKPVTVRGMLGAGARWSLHVGPGTDVGFELQPFGMGAPSWFVQPFRAGEPLREIGECTRSEGGRVSFGPELGADEIRIGVDEGEGSVTLTLGGEQPLLASVEQYGVKAGSGKGGSLRTPYETTRYTLTADPESRVSVANVRVARGDSRSESTRVEMAPGETRSWEFRADDRVDEIDATCLVGLVRVRLEQSFVAGFVFPVTAPATAPAPEATETAPEASETAPEATETAPEPAKGAPEQPPVEKPAPTAPEPVLSRAAGATVLFATSQYDAATWGAKNLLDGAVGRSHGYCAAGAGPQEVVFELARPAEITELRIDPQTVEAARNWARACELWVSGTSPYRGFEKVASLELANAPGEQSFEVAAPPARWISLRLLSNHGGSYLQLGEVSALGRFRPQPVPEPRENVLAAEGGAQVVYASSEYDTGGWAARNVIDGKLGAGCGFASSSSEPCEIVVALAAQKEIVAFGLNPYTTEGPKTWAKEVEVLVSTEAPDAGFTSVGRFALRNRVPVDPARRPPDQEFEIQPVKARFVKLRLLSNRGGAFIELGEFKAYARSNAQ